MVKRISRDDGIFAHLRRALLPQQFPVRREVELECGLRESPAAISFYDHHWPACSMLAVVAVRVAGSGLEDVLRAIGVRQLLRAVATSCKDPAEALDALAAHVDTVGIDMALVMFDIESGAIAYATLGNAGVTMSSDRKDCLETGDIVLLKAGDEPARLHGSTSEEGIGALLRSALGGEHSCACCAMLCKARGRLDRQATFPVGNTHMEIRLVVEKVRLFIEKHGVSEEDVMGVEVALDEVLTNVVNYGFEDGDVHEILLSLSIEPGLLIMEVQDDGRPFDPLNIPPPALDTGIEERQIGGLGMHFVRTLLDSVSYSRRNGWNVLGLKKRIVSDEGKAS